MVETPGAIVDIKNLLLDCIKNHLRKNKRLWNEPGIPQTLLVLTSTSISASSQSPRKQTWLDGYKMDAEKKNLSLQTDRHICLFLRTFTQSIDKPPYCCCQIDKTDEGCQPWRDWCLVLSHAEPKESNMLKEIRSWCIRKERMKNIIGKDGWMEEFTGRKKEHYR